MLQRHPLFYLLFASLFIFTNSLNASFMSHTHSLSLAETYALSDVVLLVKFIDAKPPVKKNVKGKQCEITGTTTVEVLRIGKQQANKNKFQKKERLTIRLYHKRVTKGIYLLTGSYNKELDWDYPEEFSSAGFDYLQQSPDTGVKVQKRIRFFVKYLEHKDPYIKDDAFEELHHIDTHDLIKFSNDLPRQQLRQWLTNKKTTSTRLGFYGHLLGLCGTEEDIPLLQKRITSPHLKEEQFKTGFEGMVIGYLLLAGTEGLELIEKERFRHKDCSLSELWQAQLAVQYMWTYGEGKIDKERLKQSVRILLDRPDFVDLVVANLTRWKDWSVQERLMKLYDHKDDKNLPTNKVAIICYFLACSVDVPKESKLPEPAHVKKAKVNLKILEAKDPKLFNRAKRFFFVE